MRTPSRRRTLTVVLAVLLPFSLVAQMQRKVSNEKGGFVDTPVAHPLNWWTENPLRVDTTGDLMLGYPDD